MSWQDTINQMAAKLGVPLWLNNAVTSVESGNNPSAVGDYGSSFGLYQLHQGGQAPAGVPTSALLDPVTNARYGLPGVARGYTAAGPFSDTLTWWEQFAISSGHPGGQLGNSATISEAQRLKVAYDSGTRQTVAPVSATTPTTAQTGGLASLSSSLDGAGYELLLMLVAGSIIVTAILIMR